MSNTQKNVPAAEETARDTSEKDVSNSYRAGSETPRTILRYGRLVREFLPKLTHRELKIMLVYLACADNVTGEAYPSRELIADLAGVGRDNLSRVDTSIRILERLGLLVTVRVGGGRKQATVRRVLLEPGETEVKHDHGFEKKQRSSMTTETVVKHDHGLDENRGHVGRKQRSSMTSLTPNQNSSENKTLQLNSPECESSFNSRNEFEWSPSGRNNLINAFAEIGIKAGRPIATRCSVGVGRALLATICLQRPNSNIKKFLVKHALSGNTNRIDWHPDHDPANLQLLDEESWHELLESLLQQYDEGTRRSRPGSKSESSDEDDGKPAYPGQFQYEKVLERQLTRREQSRRVEEPQERCFEDPRRGTFSVDEPDEPEDEDLEESEIPHAYDPFKDHDDEDEREDDEGEEDDED